MNTYWVAPTDAHLIKNLTFFHNNFMFKLYHELMTVKIKHDPPSVDLQHYKMQHQNDLT